MLGCLGLIALDVANEKAREAEAQPSAGGSAGSWHPRRSLARGLGRRAAAGALRRFSDALEHRRRGGLRGRVTPRPPDGVTSLHQPGWRTA